MYPREVRQPAGQPLRIHKGGRRDLRRIEVVSMLKCVSKSEDLFCNEGLVPKIAEFRR